MRTTRRRFLKGMTFAASAGSLPFLVPRTSLADDDAELAQRLAADLARHAGFGDKFSGGPGDHLVQEHDLALPLVHQEVGDLPVAQFVREREAHRPGAHDENGHGVVVALHRLVPRKTASRPRGACYPMFNALLIG